VTWTVATGAIVAASGIVAPLGWRDAGAADSPELEADVALARQASWFVGYLLVILLASVQHAGAVTLAGSNPREVRSTRHGRLNLAVLLATGMVFGVSVAWGRWIWALVAPAGFAVGLRHLSYAGRPASSPRRAWARERVTSLVEASTVLQVLVLFQIARAFPGQTGSGAESLAVLVPAAIGSAIVWWRIVVRPGE
jgi:hypothetical protein